jgi:hypothetical protein
VVHSKFLFSIGKIIFPVMVKCPVSKEAIQDRVMVGDGTMGAVVKLTSCLHASHTDEIVEV